MIMIDKIKDKELEEFKYLIDSRNLSVKERKANVAEILKARSDRFKQRSSYDIKLAKLMQLKLQMEEYLKTPKYEEEFSFSNCLATYVDTIYDKRKNFAHDISIEPLMLSQVINNHREPQEKFILRLIIHSEKSFKSLGKFDQSTWYNIYFKEKVGKIMSTQKQWRTAVEKFVTNYKLETERVKEKETGANRVGGPSGKN